MRGTLSMIGLYNYDNSLFDNLTIPDGLNADILTAAILEICGECEVIYPDFDFCRYMLGWFSQRHFYTWNELYKTLNYEYDPIANYDRKAEWSEDETTTGNGNSTGNVTSTGNGNSTSTAAVTSFNSYDFKDASKNTGESSTTNSENSTGEVKTDTTRNLTRKENISGNIGVTTTQQMIEAQRKVVEFNIYEYIAKDIKRNFCLMVY